jgi:hypothetical protein
MIPATLLPRVESTRLEKSQKTMPFVLSGLISYQVLGKKILTHGKSADVASNSTLLK